jgi:hypothetical protein
MTRKAKILWVLGGIALVVTAICFFSRAEEGEMTVLYAGLASNDLRSVSFTISNSFADEMYCFQEIHELRDGEWQPPIGGSHDEIGYLPTQCASNFTVLVPGTNRWKVEVSFRKPWPDNTFYNALTDLAYFASDHNWLLLERLLLVGYRWEARDSPEMLGHKPAEPARK